MCGWVRSIHFWAAGYNRVGDLLFARNIFFLCIFNVLWKMSTCWWLNILNTPEQQKEWPYWLGLLVSEGMFLWCLAFASTLQGYFFAVQMSDQSSKGRDKQFHRESKSGIQDTRRCWIHNTFVCFSNLNPDLTDGSRGMFLDLLCCHWVWKSPLQLLASSSVLICYECWLPWENTSKKLSHADTVILS